MLSRADVRLVSRERALPGLETLLDSEAFLGELGRVFPDVAMEAPRQIYTRYKPGTACLVGYRLVVRGVPIVVHAKAYRRDAGEKFEKACRRPAVATMLGAGKAVLREANVVVSVFPNDAVLRKLCRLEDPAALERILTTVLPDGCGHGRASVQTLRYKPERRFVGRLASPGGDPTVLRLYTPEDFVRANLSAKHIRSGERLRVARRLGSWKSKQLLILEWMPGQPLLEAFGRDTGGCLEIISNVGASLAELHAEPSRRIEQRSYREEVRGLRAAADAVSFLHPALSSRIRDLAAILEVRLAASHGKRALLHGDFHAGQVLVDDDSVVLLDLDLAARGDPATDLGTFVAQLERDAVLGRVPDGFAVPAAEALIDGYQDASDGAARDVSTHVAASLVKLAPEPFRDRVSEWPDAIEAIVERAERVLAAKGRSRVRRACRDEAETAREGVRRRRELQRLVDRALDPAEVAPLIAPLIAARHRNGPRIQISASRLRRSNPGRRCLIEYDIGVDDRTASSRNLSLLGKIRRRSLDRATHDLVEQLWVGGFDAASEDGISVPEPFGLVPELRMWLQGRVAAAPAADPLMAADGVKLAARIAEAIRKLHRSGIPARRRHGLGDEMRILRFQLGRARVLRPGWAARIDRIESACECIAASAQENPFDTPVDVRMGRR
ncbi:MAG: phosphotransferase family protein, partial [Myxococcota bacterium]